LYFLKGRGQIATTLLKNESVTIGHELKVTRYTKRFIFKGVENKIK